MFVHVAIPHQEPVPATSSSPFYISHLSTLDLSFEETSFFMADFKDNIALDGMSTMSSATQETAATLIPASQGMIKYNMYYTTSRLNVTLHEGESSNPATYYLESDCSLIKCMVFLRRGNAKTSPMVAFAKMPLTSRHIQMGNGDYSQQKAGDRIVWEELHREQNCLRRSDYQFTTTDGNDELGKRQEFNWRKDREKFAKTVYECLDGSGRTVARLFSGGALNWKKGGEVEVLEDLDERLRETVLLSALAIWFQEALCYQSWLKGYSGGSEAAEKVKAT